MLTLILSVRKESVMVVIVALYESLIIVSSRPTNEERERTSNLGLIFASTYQDFAPE
jgi:hypothetical protein